MRRIYILFFFFFSSRRRHTRFSRDWSSDVCSSDLPGDTVRARVTKVKRNHGEAIATEVLVPSAKRVEAPCAHYPACGGCRFQDLAYEVQLEQKHAQVRDALVRIARIAEPPLDAIVPADAVFHYRNKLEYSFTQTEEGPALGFHKAGRWDEVLEIDRCWLTTDL